MSSEKKKSQRFLIFTHLLLFSHVGLIISDGLFPFFLFTIFSLSLELKGQVHKHRVCFIPNQAWYGHFPANNWLGEGKTENKTSSTCAACSDYTPFQKPAWVRTVGVSTHLKNK